MPAVTVHTMFDLARIMGCHSAEIAVGPDSTVQTVLEALIAAYDGLQGRLFDPGTGGLLSYLFVELNGRDIRALQGLETSVQDGDALSVLIPVAGGA
jgi:sulfur-carrier protein